MSALRSIVASALVAAALPLSAGADGKISWFDGNSSRDALGLPRSPSVLKPDAPLNFGIDAYKSLAPNSMVDDEPQAGDTVRVYGQVDQSPGLLQAPLSINRAAGEERLPLDQTNNRLSGFGVKWQHRVDSSSSVSFAAGYNEFAWNTVPSQSLGIIDTRAALSWSNTWSGGLRPGITSSVFLGGESVRDDMPQRLGRKYYGFSVGGELTPFQGHTPYLSYSMRRNVYDNGLDDPMYLLSPYDTHSLISAGWKWKVQPNLTLQAEASYGLNGQSVDLYTPDRSRFFFGTRFDFR